MTSNHFYENWARFNIPILVEEIFTQRNYQIYIQDWNLIRFDLNNGGFLGKAAIANKNSLLVKDIDEFTFYTFESPLQTKLGKSLYGK